MQDFFILRIVIVSSMAHTNGRMNWDDLNWEKSYNTLAAYGQSKLANILHAKELAARLEGTGVTVYVLHPGETFALASNRPMTLTSSQYLARALNFYTATVSLKRI